MAAGTSGGFSPIAPLDVTKEAAAHIAVIPVANTAQIVNPAVGVGSATVFNMSPALVRGTIVFTAAAVAVGVAATRAFLVPPQGTYSFTFDTDLPDGGDVIDSITFQCVSAAVGGEASTLAALAPAAAVTVMANFIAS